jgi:hypothetical protein
VEFPVKNGYGGLNDNQLIYFKLILFKSSGHEMDFVIKITVLERPVSEHGGLRNLALSSDKVSVAIARELPNFEFYYK